MKQVSLEEILKRIAEKLKKENIGWLNEILKKTKSK